jgi:hypothetical protein
MNLDWFFDGYTRFDNLKDRRLTWDFRKGIWLEIDSRMAHSFRHGPKKHAKCFDAVIVILQFQLENGSPLFLV